MKLRIIATMLASGFCVAACGSKKPAPTEPTTDSTPTTTDPAPMTPDACVAQGGEVRGDIGDGKVACAEGEQTLGRVDQGIEGAVCCAPAAAP